jgi:hypothetical protein
LPRITNNGVLKHPRGSIPIVSSWKPGSRERTTTDNGWSGTGKIDAGIIPTMSIVTSTVSRSGNYSGSLTPVPVSRWASIFPVPDHPLSVVVLSRLPGFQLLTIGIDPLGSVSSCNWEVRTTGTCRKFHLDKKVKCHKLLTET